jgi:signal transduction histidine kinase
VTLRVARNGTRVTVEIADNGVGGADASRGTGLRGLEDRLEVLDGALRVSSRAGGGTTVIAELPCAS